MLGGSLAAYIAAEYPDDVRAIILLAGFVSGEDGRMQLEFSLWRDLIHSDRRALARIILLTGFSPDFLASLSAQQIEEIIEGIVTGNQWEGMARQTELNLVLYVSTSVRYPRSYGSSAHARRLAAVIPGARYVELNSGHLAPLECPDEFPRLVTDFLQAGEGY